MNATPVLDRRTALRLGAGFLALSMVPPAEAGWSPEVEAAIRALVGDTTPIDGEIKFQAPETAENGAFVPVTVSIDSPMTADNHIRAIHLFATKNPTPGVASFQLSPANGRATVSTRIRLAEHQTILAYAVASDGSVRRAAAQVRVTVGGCLT